MLPGSDRKDLAIQALARSATISDLSIQNGVSRKFVYQQTHKVRVALDDAFSSAAPDDEVLFEVKATKKWLHRAIVALALMCRGSYLSIREFMRDLLGVSIGMGSIHNVLQAASRQAGVINRGQDLSGIRAGLHDEIFEGATPVLAGVDAASTDCYLLVAEQHRDADTWGVHLLDATRQGGVKPDYTIADAGDGLANTLSRLAKGATSRYQKLEARNGREASLAERRRLPPSWNLRGRPKLRRNGWPATFESSPNG
jgi:hypothetical protein